MADMPTGPYYNCLTLYICYKLTDFLNMLDPAKTVLKLHILYS